MEAVIGRQQLGAPARNDRCFLCVSEAPGARFLRPRLSVLDSLGPAPFRHRPGIDSRLKAQLHVHSGPPPNLRPAGPSSCDRCIAAGTACVVVPRLSLDPSFPFLRKNRASKPWDQTAGPARGSPRWGRLSSAHPGQIGLDELRPRPHAAGGVQRGMVAQEVGQIIARAFQQGAQFCPVLALLHP